MYQRMNGGPHCGLVWVQKLSDSSSPFWFNAATDQKVIDSINIHFLTTANPPEMYMSYALTNCGISYYNQEHIEDGTPMETILIAYDTIEQSFVPRGADNSFQSPVRMGYNVAQGIKM